MVKGESIYSFETIKYVQAVFSDMELLRRGRKKKKKPPVIKSEV
jgi:hypothetical protein